VKEIQRKTIPEAVADGILNMIATGELQLGESLPPQRQLAKEMGIGLSSLREGIRSLVARGILELRPGRGTFVTKDLSVVAAKQLGLGLELEGRVSREVLEVRQVLELDVVAFAAERATDEELDQIEELLLEMQAAIQERDWRKLERLDPAFHLAIVDAAHNDILSRLVRSLYDLLQQLVIDAPFREHNFGLHCELFRALKERDADEARVVMGAILDNTRLLLQNDDST
jgi:GntR family transcriptional repressor for pyruvate dehydrogenase complex